MVAEWWSYVLSGIGVFGLVVAAARPRVGFGISIAAQILWVTYALVTDQAGFLISAGAYTVAYVRLWRRSGTRGSGQTDAAGGTLVADPDVGWRGSR